MPLLDVFWTLLMFFLFLAWISLIFTIFRDIFRTEMGGLAKAIWVLFLIVLPFLGVLIYLIVHGHDMQNRVKHRKNMGIGASRGSLYTDLGAPPPTN